MAAFCGKCGCMLLKSYFFCPKCGDKISQVGTTSSVSSRTATSTSTSTSSASFPATNSNFETFRERKETERRSFSVRKKSCSKKQRIQDSEVCITVGLMKNRKTVKRGERLPVKLSTSATAIDILEAAKKKHAAYNKRFRAGEYRLVYKDGSDVDVIPGTDEPFSLRRYKEESGFGYARINLFLLPASTIFDELQESLQETDSDIGDDLDGLEPDADHQELLQPVEWLQPSCTSGHTYNADANAWSRETEGKIECPTCFKQFPIDEVSLHADECADAFWERVGDEKEITLQNNVEDGLSQKDLKSEILQLRLRHLKEKEEAVRVTVRRKNIWDDFKRSRERYYTPDRILKVTFSGEPAVDSGGPKREFFAEVLSYVETRLFVEGIPSKSTISLNRGDFKLAGEVMAMSIVQHGQAPNFLAPEIYAYFSGNLQIQDITSPSHREFCEKIQRATNEELPDILQAEDAYPFLEEVGYHGVPARETKESIENVVRSICINLQVGKVLPQLVQLHEGLSTCGVLGEVQKSPKLWESAFVSGAGYSVTANNLIEEIQPEFSASQMKKEKEADCYHYLCEFIHSLEAKSIEELGVADFLKWLTGSRNYPPLGFPKKIRCQFLHGCPGSCKCRPTTSTCDLVFTLPVHLNTEEEMGLLMTSALTDSFGFTLL
ncbi:uncharacterized protein [Montipora capricornis]|uniref:uncharacterized protein n=1 Tax=Montipora capricornis TaxID=246305 RepID=UPI0035F1972F